MIKHLKESDIKQEETSKLWNLKINNLISDSEKKQSKILLTRNTLIRKVVNSRIKSQRKPENLSFHKRNIKILYMILKRRSGIWITKLKF